MSKNNRATKTVVMLAAFSFLSKVLGFLRETMIAKQYGSSSDSDVFFMALVTITMFTGIISATIGTTLIPILTEVEENEGREGKRKHLNNFLNIIGVTSIIITLVAIIFAPLMLKILARGFDEESFNLVVKLARIGMPTIFVSSIIGVFRGYLQSEGLFKETAISSLFVNLVMIGFLMFLSDKFDVSALMLTYVIANVIPLVFQFISLKSIDYKYEFEFHIKDVYMIRVLQMIPPILIGVAITDLNKMADNSMASGLVTGSISALNYATKLDSFTTGIFIASLMTAIFPILSQHANKENQDGFKNVITRGFNMILLITIPAAIGMMVLAYPIVKLAFERGEFTSTATAMTVGALTYYSIGLPANGLKQYISKIFYSLKDTKTPVINSAITVALNITLNIMLVGSMKHRGLALATSLANIITAFVFIYSLRKKIGPFGIKSTIIVAIKSLVSGLLMGLSAHYTYKYLIIRVSSGSIGLVLALLGAVLLAVIVYVVLLKILGVKELDDLLIQVKKKIKSKTSK
ncbi:MAG: murein biosynthesis integral membrane protein MurJ [Erysipelothrix sp.]|nr:murein biosynthesis integral membrane protein MurJ [Erysipelothrix sp.]